MTSEYVKNTAGTSEARAAPTLARDGVTFGRGRQEFHRDAPLEPRVFGEEHFAHPAGAKWREDVVAAGEQGAVTRGR